MSWKAELKRIFLSDRFNKSRPLPKVKLGFLKETLVWSNKAIVRPFLNKLLHFFPNLVHTSVLFSSGQTWNDPE